MKYLALLTSVLTIASINVFAQPITLTKRADANPPYFVQQYVCDLTKLSRRDDNSTFGPVKDSPTYTSLAVTPNVYEGLALQGVEEWLDYMKNDKEVAAMRVKIKAFENSGNIPAMKHWEDKLRTETREKQNYLVNAAFKKYIARATADESIKKYHEPSLGGMKKYSSFGEMQEDSHNYCNAKSTQ